MKKKETVDFDKAFREAGERASLSFDGVLGFINDCNDSGLLKKIDRVLGGKLILLANGIVEDEGSW